MGFFVAKKINGCINLPHGTGAVRVAIGHCGGGHSVDDEPNMFA